MAKVAKRGRKALPPARRKTLASRKAVAPAKTGDASLKQQLAQARAQQAATAAILKVIARSPADAQPVFDAIVHSAKRLIGGVSAAVTRVVGDRLHLAALTSTGKTGDKALRAAYPVTLTNSRFFGEAVRTRSALFMSDVATDPRPAPAFREAARKRGYRSVLVVPMLRDGVAIGLIHVSRVERGPFTDQQIDLLKTFADQAVIAIENARLFNDSKEALERQTATAEILSVISKSSTDTRPVFDAITQSAARLFAPCTSGILMREGGQVFLRGLAGPADADHDALSKMYPVAFDPASSTAARAMASGRIEQILDSEAPDAPPMTRAGGRAVGFRSILAAPLVSGGVGIGAITILSPAAGFRLSERQMALLKTFADQAVIAIENVRLFNETREALERQTASAEILGVISSTPTDTQPVFDAIVNSAQRLIAGKATHLLLRRDATFILAAYAGAPLGHVPDQVRAAPLDREKNFPSRAILDGAVVRVSDWAGDDVPEFEKLIGRTYGIRSGVLVPLLKDGAGIGALVVTRETAGPYHEREVTLLRSFADQAVIAIENVRLFNETREALEHQKASADILRVISSSPTDLAPVMVALAESAARLCEATDAHIWQREGDDMLAVASHGTLPLARTRLRIGRDSVVGRAAADCKLVHVHDLAAVFEKEFPNARGMKEGGYRSILAVPLVHEGSAIGAILIRRTEVRPFTPKQLALLQTFADQAVIAIQNARLFNETKEALERQTATSEVLKAISRSTFDLDSVLKTLLESASRLCAADRGLIFRPDGAGRHLPAVMYNYEAGSPLEQTLRATPVSHDRGSATGRAMIERRTAHIPDVLADADYTRRDLIGPGAYRTTLSVPMLRGEELVGAITMTRNGEPRPFTDKQIELVTTFADQAVIAIENVRLFNETREALERQTATAEILQVISSSTTDVQPVFDAIVRAAVRLCDGRLSTVLRLDGELLDLAAHHNLPAEGLEAYRRVYPRRVDRGTVAGCAILDRAVINVADSQDEATVPAHSRAMAAATGFRGILAVPMLREGEPIGVLNVGRAEPGQFSQAHVDLLKTFADQAVIAIENVRLFNETREALERQTATAEILKVIASSPSNVQPVLDAITRSAAQLFAPWNAALVMRNGAMIEIGSLAGVTRSQAELDDVAKIFPIPFDPDRVLVARVIAERRLIEVPDTEAPPGEFHLVTQTARAGNYRAATFAPLIREGEGIGVITLTHTQAGSRLTASQLALVKTFADQAVIAIENVRLFNETKEALARQTATSNVLREISRSTFDLDAILQTLLDNAKRLCGAVNCAMFLKDTDGSFRFASQVGYVPDSPLEKTLRNNPIRPGADTTTGRALLERRTVHTHDIRTEPGYRPDLVALADYRTNLAVPMLRDGEVMGAITLTRGKEVSPFTDKQIELVEGFSAQAVIAIENVRLFNETKEALERQTATSEILRVISSSPTDIQPIFDSIVQSAVRLCDGLFAAAVRFDGERLYFVAQHNFTPEGLETARRAFPMQPQRDIAVGRAVLDRTVVHFPDVEHAPRQIFQQALGYRSVLAVPILRDGEPIGAIAVTRAEARPFSDTQIELLKTFADQAVIAIENVRLFNETKEALERQTATAEILRVISSSPTDTQPVFDAIVQSGLKLFAGAGVGIAIVEGGELLVVAASGGLTSAARGIHLPISRESASGMAIVEKRVVNIRDTEAPDAPQHARDNGRRLGIRSMTQAPMFREGEPVGVIGVTLKDPGGLDDKQLALLKTFADQAVIAIENVRLFKELEARNRDVTDALGQQTATAEVLQVISRSTFDLAPVFDALVENAVRLCGAQTGMIFRRDGEIMRLDASHGAGATFVEYVKQGGIAVDRRTVTGRTAIEGRTVQVLDVLNDPDYSYGGQPIESYRTILGVPLLRDGHPIGVFALWRHHVEAFTPRQIALVETFADQAVIAIENVRLFNETKEALERQTATAEILRVISSSPTDLRPVFDAILSNATKLSDAHLGILNLYDGEKLRTGAQCGGNPEFVKWLFEREPFTPAPDSALGRMVIDKRPFLAPDLKETQGYREGRQITVNIVEVGGARTFLAVPLLGKGEVIGSISIYRPEVRPFTEKQIGLVKTFADQAVIAIENVRLFNETREALERQTATAEILRVIASSPSDVQPVFDAIVTSALRLIDGITAHAARREGDTMHLVAYNTVDAAGVDALKKLYPAPAKGYFIADAIAAGKPMFVSDVATDSRIGEQLKMTSQARGFRSFIAVPMIRKGETIGMFVVTRQEAGAFTAHEIGLLTTFADQAVIAIENVRLFNETKEALERQTATAEILKVIASSPSDVQPVFDAIAQSAGRLFAPCDSGINILEGNLIYLRAGGGAGVTPERFQNLVDNVYPLPFDANQNMVSRTILAGRIMEVTDSEGPDTTPATRATGRAAGYRSFTQVPLVRDGAGIGTIALAHPELGFKLNEKQHALLQTFADQAVIAIENVRLFKELQSRTEALTRSVGQLTALGEVGQAISSTLDLETVLKTIVSRAVQLTGLDGGSIFEYDEHGGEFHLRATENVDEEYLAILRRTAIRTGEGAVGRAALSGEPVQIADIQEQGYQSRLRDAFIRAGYRAVLVVPLRREEHVIGALSVTRKTPGPFAPEIVELLKTFATQSALAIQNARLFREIADKGRQLEDASRHKSNFLASMSHELRTPLNAILGFNEMIIGQVYGEVPADMQEPLADIQKSGKHLLRLINNVLDLAKIEAGRMELSLQDYSVQDTVESVRSTLRPLAAEKGLEFLASVPNDIALAYGDGGRIAQCLMNLAGNSLKFTKAGKVEILVEEKDGLLTYCVTDTGIGIPPDKIESLFTEFKQSDATIASEYGGTGLGLSITKQFIEMHGGRIWVESELGKGSAFIFEVPLRVKTT